MIAAFLDRCRQALGPRHVLTDADVVAGQSVDWTRRWQGRAGAVLRPGTTDEVAAVVRAARDTGVALVPQGGNTGLVGGSVPVDGEVVVDLRRLDRLDPVDRLAAQVTVGAGVTLARLQAHLRGSGLAFGVDLAARDSATIGGMVATNAGGLQVLRHGHMRAQVLGVTAVLGTGEVVEVNPRGLTKDNTGYDLAGLLCGSEGTLGIVTEARLRLVPAHTDRAVALLAFTTAAEAVAALPVLRAVPAVSAIEVMAATGLDVVAEHLDQPFPIDPLSPWVLLVEVVGDDDPTDHLVPILDHLGDVIVGSAVAADGPGTAALWRWRDAHTEAISRLGVPHKADVTVPAAAMADFLDSVPAAVGAARPGSTTICFGHLGDGNVHVNVVGPDPDDEAVLDVVYEAAVAAGGSVSAEHGIGRAKRHWLVAQRGSEAVAAMRAVKDALDPDHILNPNVLLP